MPRYGKATSQLLKESAKLHAGRDEEAAFSRLTVAQRKRLQKALRERARTLRVVTLSESQMWAQKRSRQRSDLDALDKGLLSNNDVNWFASGVARRAKILGSLIG